MDDLVQWLRAQLDEDERIARAATPRYRKSENRSLWIHSDSAVIVTAEYFEDAAHIAAHDPARVLREIEAKRRIVDAYLPPGSDPHPGLPCINFEGQNPADYDGHDSCSRHLEASKRLLHDDYVLRLLALPYADRPGFQESWRP